MLIFLGNGLKITPLNPISLRSLIISSLKFHAKSNKILNFNNLALNSFKLIIFKLLPGVYL